MKIRFDAGIDARGGARRLVAQVLNDWGYQDLIDDATLVASELATNAVVHPQSPFTVELSVRERRADLGQRFQSFVTGTTGLLAR